MQRLYRFAHLPWRRKALVLEAAGCLAVAWLLVRGVHFRFWSSWLGVQAPGDVGLGSRHCDGRVRDIARLVTVINAELGGRLTCLMQAMAVHWMLHRRRISSSLVLGTSHVADGRKRLALEAHAWVRVGADIVLGEHGGRFTPVSSFVRRHDVSQDPAR